MNRSPGGPLHERLARRLEESEELHRSLFGLNPDPVYCFDVSGRLVSGNAALEALLGLDLGAIVGRDHLELVTASDRDRVRMHFLRAAEGQPQHFEYPVIAGDGREVTLAATFVPLLEDGRILGVYATAKDVTAQREAERALRESEERYRLLADHASDMISLHDLDGRFLYASPAAHRLLGYHPVELIGRSVYDFAHPDDVAALRAAHETVLTQTGRAPLAYRARRADGTEGWFETTARMALAADGTAPQIVGLTRDVSERRALEQQLGHMQKLEAVGRLAGGLAHDFNNLLTVVLGRTESLLERVPAENAIARELEEIRAAARRSVGLVAQLLAVGRKPGGTPTSVDLNTTLLEFLSLLSRLAGTNNELATDLDPELWLIHADNTQLEQVLLNLVVNARDALAGTSGCITVTTRNVQLGGPPAPTHPLLPPGEYIMLSVHDTGCGMDEDTVARIFEPFYTTKAEGTGLGLATVYAVAQAAGGDVTAESRPGIGTTFRMFLPRDPATSDMEAGSGVDGDETILLVEDEAEVRSLMQTILERHGYRVHAFGTPHEAIAAAESLAQPPHLLLTDVMMPQLKGPELAVHLRERFPALRTLYITGYSDAAVLRLGIREDGALLVQKPFTAATLACTVRTALGARRGS